MIALIQRVSRAEVHVGELSVGAIGQGIAASHRANAATSRLLDRQFFLGSVIFSHRTSWR